MAIFRSDDIEIGSSISILSTFLATPSNIKDILPEDRIENWSSTDTGCSFKIKGLADISLELASHTDDLVCYQSGDNSPFPFILKFELAVGTEGVKLNSSFDAEVNGMMAMMLKSPLVAFLNSLGEALVSKNS